MKSNILKSIRITLVLNRGTMRDIPGSIISFAG
jgi:hypothetical protein